MFYKGTMSPKRKAESLLKDLKPDKRITKKSNEDYSSVKKVDTTKKALSGRNLTHNIKVESSSPLLDHSKASKTDNYQKVERGDFINFALNNILKNKV